MRSRVIRLSRENRSNLLGRRIEQQPCFFINLFQNRTIYRVFASAACTSLSASSFSPQTVPLLYNKSQQFPFLPMSSLRKPTQGSFQTVGGTWFSTTSTNGKRHASDDVSISAELQYILSENPPEDHQVLMDVFNWVRRVVIGLNLCPFAEKPFKGISDGKMKFEVIRGQDEEEIIRQVLAECFVRTTKPGTSILICPDLYPSDFESFLEIQNILSDGLLVDNDLTDDIQIAPFHPLFQFADVEKEGEDDDIGDTDGASEGFDNYTNRSPYPIFHILREEEVSKAVDLLDGDSSKVWGRNVDLLEELGDALGQEEFKILLSGGVDTELQDSNHKKIKLKLQAILKKFRTTRTGS